MVLGGSERLRGSVTVLYKVTIPCGAFSSPIFTMAAASVFETPVVIVGAGVSGLMTAYTLLEDGFQNVTLVTRDKSVGGTWARERVYPGLRINKYVFPPS